MLKIFYGLRPGKKSPMCSIDKRVLHMPEPKGANGAPEKKTDEVTPPAGDKKPEEKVDEKKVGEVINPEKKEDKKDPETVPLATHLELKKEHKEMKKALEALEKKVDSGASAEDISEDIAALGKEFDVDQKFLGKLTKIIETRAEKKAEAKTEARLKPLEEKEKKENIDKIFSKHFSAALERMPEFKDIADPDVIKTLSLDPKNADKTFSQLIEQVYGKALGGKRTIERTTPHGGKESGEIDYDKAKRDPKYFDEIMADPESKKKYNEGLTGRLANHL